MTFGGGHVLYQNDVFGSLGGLFTLATNMVCLTLWLQCTRCKAVTPYQFYIVGGHSYWWIMLGLPFPMIYHGIPTSVHSWSALAACFVIHNNPPGGVGLHAAIESTPALMKSIKVSYYEWYWLWDTFMASYVMEENVCHWLWYQQCNDDLIYNLTSDTS